MATPTQQSSPATALPMLVKKGTSSTYIRSYPPLFVASLSCPGWRHECPDWEKPKPQIQLSQLVKQKWGTLKRIHARKYVKMSHYYISEKKRKTMDVQQGK